MVVGGFFLNKAHLVIKHMYTHTHVQSGSASTPVYLRGKSDRFVYRSAMFVSLLGLGVTMYGIYLMATGTLPKKER